MLSAPLAPEDAAPLFRRLANFDSLALAVSGGADSLALLHLVAGWRGLLAASRPALTVLTVDHGLRPGSASEAALVAAGSAKLGLRHATLVWRGPKPKHGVEAAARQVRYDLMADYCRAEGIPALVTAHHLDDQAETLLMRLARGSGADGLAAMRSETLWSGIRILRPMLDVPKARLRATARGLDLRVAEDESNADVRFERARLRAARPLLEALGLTPASLALSARRLRRAADALEGAAASFVARHAGLHEAGWAELAMRPFRDAAEDVAIRVLGRILEAVGPRRAAPPRLSRLEAVVAKLRTDAEGRATLGGCRITAEPTRITVVREIRAPGLPVLTLEPGRTALWDRRILVGIGKDVPEPIRVAALGSAGLQRLRAAGMDLPGPRAALLATAAFWRHDELAAVPQLGFRSEVGGVGRYAARLANAGLLLRGAAG